MSSPKKWSRKPQREGWYWKKAFDYQGKPMVTTIVFIQSSVVAAWSTYCPTDRDWTFFFYGPLTPPAFDAGKAELPEAR